MALLSDSWSGKKNGVSGPAAGMLAGGGWGAVVVEGGGWGDPPRDPGGAAGEVKIAVGGAVAEGRK